MLTPLSPLTFSTYAQFLDRCDRWSSPAALNFGDCLAYATAVVDGEPLLCVGDDFPQTDCPLA